MKAMILAAGRGTRVKPITDTVPKPMVPLVGKPVMEAIIERLQEAGVDEIVINTSHLSSVIEDYFRDGSRFGVQIAYSYEGVLTDEGLESKALGSAGGMKKIQDFSGFFDDTFIVLCGDALIDIDFSKLLEFHRSKGSMATIVLKDVSPSEVYKYGVVQTSSDGKVVAFQEKPDIGKAVSTTINTGIYMFEPEVFDYIPSGLEYDLGSQLFPELVSSGAPVYGLPMAFQWLDVGSINDYWNVTRQILSGKVNHFPLPGREIAKGIFAGSNISVNLDRVKLSPPLYIGSSTFIGNGAEIVGPSVIGPNCVIEAGAFIKESIVSDYTRIGSVAVINEKIVFGSNCISPYGGSLDVEEHNIGWIIDDARRCQALSDEHMMLLNLAKSLPVITV